MLVNFLFPLFPFSSGGAFCIPPCPPVIGFPLAFYISFNYFKFFFFFLSMPSRCLAGHVIRTWRSDGSMFVVFGQGRRGFLSMSNL
jgi:hypothetical protein